MNRSTAGRIGAHESWARTPDRAARTAAARRAGPSSLDWHLARLGPALDGAPERDRIAAATAARAAYYARLSAAGNATRGGAA
jgi:hypothetical protein